jgi:arabinosaccharide transport system substrate-binding protein
MCVDAPDLNASGHKMRLEGFVVAGVMADWLAGVWRRELPGLAGKVKLMPLPAWEAGGRRTTVVGGTMVAIARGSQDPDTAWEVAKALYLSPELAESQYRRTNIISPVKTLWNEPFYHEPDPYFSGQRTGSLFIEQAPQVPRRVSTPYLSLALERLVNVMMALTAHADRERDYSVEGLMPVAARLLVNAQSEVQRQLDRNRLARQ